MKTKMFEVRDAATFIPIMAVKLQPGCEADRYLLARAGYGTTAKRQEQYVFLCRINGGEGKGACDPYEWGQCPRTIPVAHKYIIENFDKMESGAVVDVEFILGQRTESKKSERLTEAL